jgi:hypothetical protein
MDFSAFDKQIDLSQLKKDAEEIKKNGGTGDFPEIPAGSYVTKIEKLELGATKDGRPMLKAMFRIIEGEYKKHCLFFNRVLFGTKNDANMIAGAMTWLESLEPSEEVGPIVFNGYSDLAELIMDIDEDISDLEYEVDYDPDEFNSISISEVFEK